MAASPLKIVVFGAGGLIGSQVTRLLQAAGHSVVAATTKSGVNVLTGEGVQSAVHGANVVLDLTNSPSFEDTAVMNFFNTSAAVLLPAERAAGVQHHLILSVVGCDRPKTGGYMKAKVAQEEAVKASGLGYTIVRATQFMEFMSTVVDSGARPDGSVRLSSVLMQPVAAEEVAATMARLAVQPPLNGTVDLAGPEQLRLDAIGRQLLTAKGDARAEKVVTDDSTGYFGGEVDDQSIVPIGANGEVIKASITLDKWLAVHAKL